MNIICKLFGHIATYKEWTGETVIIRKDSGRLSTDYDQEKVYKIRLFKNCIRCGAKLK